MDVLIYGGGLLGRQVHYLVETYFGGSYRILGFIDDVKEKEMEVVNDLRVLGSLEEMNTDPNYVPDRIALIMAIGYSNMPGRFVAFSRAKGMGYRFESLIHPEAVVEKNVRLGEGVVVLAGVVVDQYVEIREANYLDIGVLVGENCMIGANNYFSAGTTVGGSVTIGGGNFFGLSTTVVNDISIGNNNFINAKTLIYKNIGDNRKVVELHEQHLSGKI